MVFDLSGALRLVDAAWADPASGMVFCLSEGPTSPAVRRIHERAGHPADDVYPITLDVE